MHGATLTQVGATLELTKSEADRYLTTRRWARSLLTWLPQIAGFRYRLRHDEDSFAYVLIDEGETPGRARGALSATGSGGLDLTSPDG